MEKELKTTAEHRERVRTYEQKHDRFTIITAKGTRDRIQALGLDCTPAMFAKFATEFMLNYCERRKHDAVN